MVKMSIDLNEPPSRPGARWSQERRLEFIEYRLRWDGTLNRSDLTSFFGISVPQASLDLAEYSRRGGAENLEYDASTKAYRASGSFKPLFESSRLERYLEDLLRVAVNTEVPYGSFIGWHPPVAFVPRPGRRLDTETVIAVIAAIRQSAALNIRYQSFSEPTPTTRKVSPHALVSDGFRWHMRAFCHKRGDFRDFVLSRILEIEVSEKDADRASLDDAWNSSVRLVLVPHPALNEAHKKVIEIDYGMDQGECVLECRRALLFYVLQQLGLRDDASEKSGEEQQIVLKNRKEIEALLPKTKQR